MTIPFFVIGDLGQRNLVIWPYTPPSNWMGAPYRQMDTNL